MHRSQLDLQYYVLRAGDQVFSPPFVMDQMDMLAFVLQANQQKLDALLTRELNDPWEQALASRGVRHRYVAASDWVVFVLSEVEELYPAIFQRLLNGTADEKQAERERLRHLLNVDDAGLDAMAGVTAKQRELIAMIPVVDEGSAAGTGDSQLWYVPMVLNDCPPAVVAGREVFGYPKVLAKFRAKKGAELRKSLLEENVRVWDKLTIRTHGPVKRSETANGRKRRSEYRLALVTALEIAVNDAVPDGKPEHADRLMAEAKECLSKRIEFLLLRQFRDPQYEGYASYQAAVSGKVTAGTGSMRNLLDHADDRPQRFSLRFPNAMGPFPHFVDDLGLLEYAGPDGVKPRAVFMVQDAQLVVTRGEIKWDKA